MQVVALLGTVEASKLQPELLDECLEKLADLLQDPCYDARRHGTTIIPTLYGKWSDEQVFLELHLASWMILLTGNYEQVQVNLLLINLLAFLAGHV